MRDEAGLRQENVDRVAVEVRAAAGRLADEERVGVALELGQGGSRWAENVVRLVRTVRPGTVASTSSSASYVVLLPPGLWRRSRITRARPAAA